MLDVKFLYVILVNTIINIIEISIEKPIKVLGTLYLTICWLIIIQFGVNDINFIALSGIKPTLKYGTAIINPPNINGIIADLNIDENVKPICANIKEAKIVVKITIIYICITVRFKLLSLKYHKFWIDSFKFLKSKTKPSNSY